MTETLSIKLSVGEKAQLKSIAKARKTSVSALLREGLQKVLEGDESGTAPSCYDLMARYFEESGHLGESGLGNLSSDKSRLENIGKK